MAGIEMDPKDRRLAWAQVAGLLIASGILLVLVGWPVILLNLLTHKPVAPVAFTTAGGTAAIVLGFMWLSAMGLQVTHVKVFGLTVWRR